MLDVWAFRPNTLIFIRISYLEEHHSSCRLGMLSDWVKKKTEKVDIFFSTHSLSILTIFSDNNEVWNYPGFTNGSAKTRGLLSQSYSLQTLKYVCVTHWNQSFLQFKIIINVSVTS